MSTNIISSLTTIQFESPGGPAGVILLNLNVADTFTADPFLREVAERFKLQRLSSPLRTQTLLVTIAGEMSVDNFARRWQDLATEDATLGLIMSQMRRAEATQAGADGQPCATASLLPDACPAISQPKTPVPDRALHGSVRVDSRSGSAGLLATAAPA